MNEKEIFHPLVPPHARFRSLCITVGNLVVETYPLAIAVFGV
jgi:hypothetical protein